MFCLISWCPQFEVLNSLSERSCYRGEVFKGVAQTRGGVVRDVNDIAGG